MAKKTFNNLKPSAARKPSDDKIDDVLASLDQEKKQVKKVVPQVKKKPAKKKLIPFQVRLPENYYDALEAEASDRGLTMKHIMIEALNERLKERL